MIYQLISNELVWDHLAHIKHINHMPDKLINFVFNSISNQISYLIESYYYRRDESTLISDHRSKDDNILLRRTNFDWRSTFLSLNQLLLRDEIRSFSHNAFDRNFSWYQSKPRYQQPEFEFDWRQLSSLDFNQTSYFCYQ